MTSRERVLATIEGKPVDRVPVMHWPNPHAALRCMAEIRPAKSWLMNFLGTTAYKKFISAGAMDGKEIWRALPLLFQVYGCNTYSRDLGSDLGDITYGSADYWGKVYRKNGRIQAKDAFGCIRGIGGIYLDVIDPGIKNIKDMINFEFPDATHDKHYARIKKYRAKNPGACIYSGNFGVQDIPTTQMWSMEPFMMAMIDYPDEVKGFQARLTDYMIDIGIREIRAGADLIFIYDDYGYTGRPLISMDMWKEFTYPPLKRMIEVYHEEGAKVMLHSCGYQMPFLEHYVAADLDVIQTFQPKAGNDFAEAYAQYGDRLTFNTGIDIQVGEMITPQELRESILEAYRIGGRNGHHILGMTHMLQYTMPLENMKALFDTVWEIQEGKHDQ